MSKLKKILITLVIAIIAILGLRNSSSAYHVGQVLNINGSAYNTNPNLFCVQRDQKFYGVMTYDVISQVRIEGDKSTDHTGKTIKNSANARFGYILSKDNGPDKLSGPVQNAIWDYTYTWMNRVGQYHAGLYRGFASPTRGFYNTWIEGSSAVYEGNYVAEANMIDNTKKDKIKPVAKEKNGKAYIEVGPFNWTFGGNLTEIKVYDQNDREIPNVIYSQYVGTTEKQVNIESIKSGSNFYISVPADGEVSEIKRITAKGQMMVNGVNVWFLDSRASIFQNLIIREPYSTTQPIEGNFEYNIKLLGNLKVIKVNKDNTEVKLKGVGFNIENKSLGKFVKQNEDGTISYVERSEATEFITDNNGEIEIKNLLVGDYLAYETQNPNYGYEMITEGQQKTVIVDKTAELQIPNKQIYIKLSGYVWLDEVYGKGTERNDLFKDNDYDDADRLLSGITVRLKDKQGNTIKEAQTDSNGSYLFVDVLIEELENYHIEFEYDGLTYTNVIPHIEKDNGSKSAESVGARKDFNNNYATVEGGEKDYTGITKNTQGQKAIDLEYNVDLNEHRSTLMKVEPLEKRMIIATTDEAKYSIRSHFTYGQEEIKYINLGLYKREQPDIALVKDLENVKLAINGYNHIYNYANRFKNQSEDGYVEGFNVGVKFGNEYGAQKYTRAIYRSDIDYVNENDRSRELKVYVTYRIRVINESATLTAKINSIADYYDSNYTLLDAGTGINAEGNIEGKVECGSPEVNGEYTKALINTNATIEAQKAYDVYVRFELNREAVAKIVQDQENLDNVAEINSYSIFDKDGAIYAGIDLDSNPANTTPGNKNTYQDDTDKAPGLLLELADDREIRGTVFLDETTGELRTGEERKGNGTFDEGEKGIPGVQVTLTELSGSGVEPYTAETDENGNFVIKNFIPGNYKITYTWGDETYTVQNYKGTIYDASRDQNNKNWHKLEVDTRKTDAIDNYNQDQEAPKGSRLQIDEEYKLEDYSTTPTRTKMDSTTPEMAVTIENLLETTSDGDRLEYVVRNVDFGIVERPRQDLELTKKISKIRVRLANGQVISESTMKDGVLVGNNLAYMPPSPESNPLNGFVRVEIDSELMQGATLEVEYEIAITNKSELDYTTEKYYTYGIIDDESKIVTITPTEIADYLDAEFTFNEEDEVNSANSWKQFTGDEFKSKVSSSVYNKENSTFGDKKLLVTTYFKDKGIKLKPTETQSLHLNASKRLSSSGETYLNNEAEIIKLEKTGGRITTSTPGNYIPGLMYEPDGVNEPDNGMAETAQVVPPTGENLNLIIPAIIGTVILAIVGAGVVIIKKKVI